MRLPSKEKLERFNNICKYLSVFVWGGMAGVGVIALLLMFGGNISMAIVGCGGIEEVYNKTSDFWTGALYIRSSANMTDLYDPVNNSYNEQPAKPPSALLSGEPVDCESVSIAIGCLSTMYDDIECVFYTENGYNPVVTPAFAGHLGINCRNSTHETTPWIQLH